MVRIFSSVFRYFTLPAFVLDIYSVIIQNLNVWLLIALSAVSIFGWIVGIKKNRAEKAAFEAQKKFYDMQCAEMENSK